MNTYCIKAFRNWNDYINHQPIEYDVWNVLCDLNNGEYIYVSLNINCFFDNQINFLFNKDSKDNLKCRLTLNNNLNNEYKIGVLRIVTNLSESID